MAYYLPEEETLDRAGLEQRQRRKLARVLEAVRAGNAFYRAKWGQIAFDSDHDPIDRLPLTTRAEIQDDQLVHPPYGTNLSRPLADYVRMHQTSGSTAAPLRWLDTAESWEWFQRCWFVIFAAAGVRPEDRFCFPFSFGPFIGFWAAFEAAAAQGHLCLPAGGMTTRARLRYIFENQATVVCCTPTYALRMAEVAAEESLDLAHSAVRVLIVAGEPGGSIPATRARIESAWGARVFDHPGMTEVGAWGFECEQAPGGVHVMEHEFIAEVLDPATQRPVGAGETGELVLTNLGRLGSPLIRYRTGDQVRMTVGRCACGRSFARLEGGILGRTDDVLWIRGNNVFPSAVEAVVREFEAVAEFRMHVDGQGPMAELCLEIEPAAGRAVGELDRKVAAAVRDRLNFTPRVTLVEADSLPRFEMKAKRLIRE